MCIRLLRVVRAFREGCAGFLGFCLIATKRVTGRCRHRMRRPSLCRRRPSVTCQTPASSASTTLSWLSRRTATCKSCARWRYSPPAPSSRWSSMPTRAWYGRRMFLARGWLTASSSAPSSSTSAQVSRPRTGSWPRRRSSMRTSHVHEHIMYECRAFFRTAPQRPAGCLRAALLSASSRALMQSVLCRRGWGDDTTDSVLLGRQRHWWHPGLRRGE